MKALYKDKPLCRPRAPQCYYVTLPFQERPLQDKLHPVEEKEAATGSMREKGDGQGTACAKYQKQERSNPRGSPPP